MACKDKGIPAGRDPTGIDVLFSEGRWESPSVVLRSCLQLVVTEAELAGHNVSEGL